VQPLEFERMRMALRIILILAISLSVAHAKRKTPWSRYATAADGKSEAIGRYAGGCLIGAVQLPATGEGFVSIRRFRNRYYGHSDLINFVGDFGKQLSKQDIEPIFVGDMSQPRGGLMGYGHRSHQLGLDVDMWFARPPVGKRDKDEYFPSLVDRATETIVAARWTPKVVSTLRTAAKDPRVSRIFVHWVIKQALCKTLSADAKWLRKVRPWWGHDRHFHVRLSCPKENKDCQNQGAIRAGNGCGKEVWFSNAKANARKKKVDEKAKVRALARAAKGLPKRVGRRKKPRSLVPRCRALLEKSPPPAASEKR
jgi:penicillin-insensitive murein endopeptidase